MAGAGASSGSHTSRATRGQLLAAQTVDPAEELDVLVHRQALVEREALRHVADAALDAFRVAPDVDAAHERGAGGRLQQAAQHPDGGRLAGAVAAQKAEDLSRLHVERHMVDGHEIAEAPRQVANFDRRCLGHRPTARSRRASASRTDANALVRSS
jgi:hypothetical protein